MGKRLFSEKIKLQTYDDMFGMNFEASEQVDEAQVISIPLSDLYSFRNHPFKVIDDEKMAEMVTSIKKYGVLIPGLARPRAEGGFEIIAGHRRKRASELAGLKEMPFIVSGYSDDQAVIIMVDSNIQRENISPSEKAKAYHMKYVAMKHQGIIGGSSLETMSEQTGESQKTVQRYIALGRLNDGLLDLVDSKQLGIKQGVELANLDSDQQELVLRVLQEYKGAINLAQADKIKEAGKKGQLSNDFLQELLSMTKQTRKVSLSQKRLDTYFDATVSNKEIEELIIMLLDEWKVQGGRL